MFLMVLRMVVLKTLKSFGMHDLLHDLAQSVMGNDCRIVNIVEYDIVIDLSRVRHASVHSNQLMTNVESLSTCVLLTRPHDDFCHLNFCSLRAFDSSFFTVISIPSFISNSKHVRYLNLSSSTRESFLSIFAPYNI